MSQPDNSEHLPDPYVPPEQAPIQPSPYVPPSGQSPYEPTPINQAPYQQPTYPQAPYPQAPVQPNQVKPERTDRELWKWIVFGILTLGIYDIVVMTELTNAANRIIQDGKRSMHFCLLTFVFSWLTLGIAVLVWYHRISNRIGDELERRGYTRMIDASDYWLYVVLPSIVFNVPSTYAALAAPDYIGWAQIFTLIGVIIPFYYLHKLIRAMNALCWDQNARIEQSQVAPAAQASPYYGA